jgi:hypothetical protein
MVAMMVELTTAIAERHGAEPVASCCCKPSRISTRFRMRRDVVSRDRNDALKHGGGRGRRSRRDGAVDRRTDVIVIIMVLIVVIFIVSGGGNGAFRAGHG